MKNTKRTKLDSAGRIVIPKPMRDKLGLGPGDAIEVTLEDRDLRIRPSIERASLIKKRGVWVMRTGIPISADMTNRVLSEIRESNRGADSGDER